MSDRSSWKLLEGLFEILALFSIVVGLIFYIIGPFNVGSTAVDSNVIATVLMYLAIASGLQAIYFNFRSKETET